MKRETIIANSLLILANLLCERPCRPVPAPPHSHCIAAFRRSRRDFKNHVNPMAEG